MFKLIKNRFSALFFSISFWLESFVAKADVVVTNPGGNVPSLGSASIGLLQPVSIFTKTLYNICYVIGAMLIVGSFVQYRDHRNNPSQVPLNRPVTLLLLGLLLIILPLIASLSAGSAFLRD